MKHAFALEPHFEVMSIKYEVWLKWIFTLKVKTESQEEQNKKEQSMEMRKVLEEGDVGVINRTETIIIFSLQYNFTCNKE